MNWYCAAAKVVSTLDEMPSTEAAATLIVPSLELKFDAAKGKLDYRCGTQLGGLVSYNIDRLHELDEAGVVGFVYRRRDLWRSRGWPTTTSVTSMTGSSSKVRRSWANWGSWCWCTAKTH